MAGAHIEPELPDFEQDSLRGAVAIVRAIVISAVLWLGLLLVWKLLHLP